MTRLILLLLAVVAVVAVAPMAQAQAAQFDGVAYLGGKFYVVGREVVGVDVYNDEFAYERNIRPVTGNYQAIASDGSMLYVVDGGMLTRFTPTGVAEVIGDRIPIRSVRGMTYDSSDGVLIVAGGGVAYTIDLDGERMQIATQTGGAAGDFAFGAALAYDAELDSIVGVKIGSSSEVLTFNKTTFLSTGIYGIGNGSIRGLTFTDDGRLIGITQGGTFSEIGPVPIVELPPRREDVGCYVAASGSGYVITNWAAVNPVSSRALIDRGAGAAVSGTFDNWQPFGDVYYSTLLDDGPIVAVRGSGYGCAIVDNRDAELHLPALELNSTNEWRFPFTIVTDAAPDDFWDAIAPGVFAALICGFAACGVGFVLGAASAPGYGAFAAAVIVAFFVYLTPLSAAAALFAAIGFLTSVGLSSSAFE